MTTPGTGAPQDSSAGGEASGAEAANGFELIRRGLAGAAPEGVALPSSSLLNMELSNLAFQERVLELADDADFPLLERVRFVSIFGSNMDEFAMTRVAGFQRQLGLGNEKRTLDGLRPAEQLRLIRERTDELLEFAYKDVIPRLEAELSEHGVEIVGWEQLSQRDREALRWQYGANLETLLTPLPVHSRKPFPHVRNLRPSLAVELEDAEDDDRQLAILPLPGDAATLVPLPGGRRLIPLEEVLRKHLPRLFPGARVTGAHLFRVTRSGNLSLQADAPEDVVAVVEENVARRPFAPVVRLEVEQDMPRDLEALLLEQFAEEARGRSSHLAEEDVYRLPGLMDLKRLERVAGLPIPELRFPKQKRKTPLPRQLPVVERIAREPVLVRFPQHAFDGTVGRFIREAANDPAVEEMRVTLYRTNPASRVVRLLRRAHRNGKRVIVFIEVKASFDERRNIEWGRSLEAAGIEVLYGPPTLKVHAKLAIVRRREGDRLTTYSYIGTGNLNAATAASYTDLGILTADAAIGAELIDLFEALADRPAAGEYRNLLVAPFNMRQRFVGLIQRETEHAKAGRVARITAKLNGIADRQITSALYEASRAGVRIDLVVRGICSLRPGVEGLSENIRVVANAGRYLEHSRIFRFENAGDPEYFIGSADWRGRNLGRRVEVAVPIELESHRNALDRILSDRLHDAAAWELRPNGEYQRVREAPVS